MDTNVIFISYQDYTESCYTFVDHFPLSINYTNSVPLDMTFQSICLHNIELNL